MPKNRTHSMNVPIVMRWMQPINGLPVAAAAAASPPVMMIMPQATREKVPARLSPGCFLSQRPISKVVKMVPSDNNPARMRCIVPANVTVAPRGSMGKNKFVKSPIVPTRIMHQLPAFPIRRDGCLLLTQCRKPIPKPISMILQAEKRTSRISFCGNPVAVSSLMACKVWL